LSTMERVKTVFGIKDQRGGGGGQKTCNHEGEAEEEDARVSKGDKHGRILRTRFGPMRGIDSLAETGHLRSQKVGILGMVEGVLENSSVIGRGGATADPLKTSEAQECPTVTQKSSVRR